MGRVEAGGGTGMLTDVVNTEAEFDALRPEWNSLVPRLSQPSPYVSWEWNRSWWRHFGSGHHLHIVTFREAGRLEGIAQFYRRRFGPPGAGIRALVPLGWEGNGRRQGITEHCELLFPEAARRTLMTALSDWLGNRRWSVALLPGTDPGEELPQRLLSHVVIRGKPSTYHHRALPATYAELVAGLNKSMRDNVKYYPRLLERTGHRFQLRVCDSANSVGAALSTFLELHQARARSITGVHHRDKFAFADRRAFLIEVAPRLAALGQLRLGLLEVDRCVVAAQMWLEMNDTMFIHYTGYDPAWAANSVQLIATLECLRWCIGRGVRRVEFLRGSGQRNERWDVERRVRVNLTLGRWPAPMRSLLRVQWLRRELHLQDTSLGPATGGGG